MKPVVHQPGILVSEIPKQVDLQPSGFMLDEYKVTRRAEFQIRARGSVHRALLSEQDR